MKALRVLVCFFVVSILLALPWSALVAGSTTHAKGVVLFIGDGMGLNAVKAAEIYSNEASRQPLSFSQIKIKGITYTRSANSEVTDSAAAITALMSGEKTYNGRLNILPNDQGVYTIPKRAREKGLSLGVVSTTRLTHATPAGTYSQAMSRDQEQLIADQFLHLAPDVALAGGLQYFQPSTVSKKSKRTDQRDLVFEAKKAGYTFVSTASQLQALDASNVKKLLGLFSNSHMSYEIDRINDPSFKDQPSLAQMTQAALRVVSKNPKGFFLMVEGGRIDHACHSHDIAAAIHEVIAFDNAVKAALEFQKTHPNVLIIVTADHETGGLGLGRGTEYALDILSIKPIRKSIESMSKKFSENPQALDALLRASGFELNEKEKQMLLNQSFEKRIPTGGLLGLHGTINNYVGSWFGYALSEIISVRAKVGWTSFVHTADPVVTYAIGPSDIEFLGNYDNTEVARKIFMTLGLNQ